MSDVEKMRALGRKGGAVTRAKYDVDYFRTIAKRGGAAGKGKPKRKKREKPTLLPNVPPTAMSATLNEILARLEGK